LNENFPIYRVIVGFQRSCGRIGGRLLVDGFFVFAVAADPDIIYHSKLNTHNHQVGGIQAPTGGGMV